MPTHVIERKPKAVKLCRKCGYKLDALNKAYVCRNEKACNERASAKFALHAKAASNAPKGELTFKVLLDAVCEHFNYDEAERKTFLSHALLKEYQHPRYTLAYLMVNDLKMSYEDAATYIDRDRKTVAVGNLEVKGSPAEYAHDIESIRKMYNEKLEIIQPPEQ